MKRFLMLAIALLLAVSLVACGASFKADNAMTSETYFDGDTNSSGFDYGYDAENDSFSGTADDLSERGVKMVYTANIEMQTLDYEKATADIAALTERVGGYFEEKSFSNRSSGYRYANYTVRVPAEQFADFCAEVGTLCHVTWSNDTAENISEQYYDTLSRLETAQIKLERLQELLKKAESMEDIITIESAISETEREIENLSGMMRHYDTLVDYATVYLSLSEVYKLSGTEEAPKTFGEKLANAFTDGLAATGEALEDFAVWLAYSWLGILIFLVCAFAAVKIFVRVFRGRGIPKLRRKKKTGEEMPENKTEE